MYGRPGRKLVSLAADNAASKISRSKSKSRGAEAAREFAVSLFLGDIQGSKSDVVLQSWVGAVLDQQIDHVLIAILGCSVNGGPSAMLASIGIRAMLQQNTYSRKVMSGGSGMERRDLHAIA